MDNLKDRERTIVRLLADDPLLTINEIAGRLRVSVVTARSDLDSLAEKGYLVRTRGGALPAFHPEIISRQQQDVEVKRRIARAAAELVEDGDSIMIESGTTTALVARYLLGRKNLKIVTDSTLILPYVRANPMVTLEVVGGIFRPATESMIGPVTVRQLETYHVKYSFIGSDGFSCEYGLTTNFVDAAEVTRTMAEHCDTVVLLADSGKYGRRGYTRYMELSQVDRLITDTGMDEDAVGEISACGVDVTRV